MPTWIPFAGNGTKGRLQVDKFVCRGEVVSERHLANSSAAACDARFGSGEVNLKKKKPSADIPFIWSFDERVCGKVEENGLLSLHFRKSWCERADVFALKNRR